MALQVRQLDVLRGLAIVMMVVNHASVALPSPDLQRNAVIAGLSFIGSFAPVVFFFATGFGIGIARDKVTTREFQSSVFKSLLLVVADQFLYWKNNTPSGLDFLSFIAISTVLVNAVAAYSRPVRLSSLLVVASLALRFACGSWLSSRISATPLIDWIIGYRAVENVSYPLSPWIIYPLLGFIMARRYRSCDESLAQSLLPWPSVLASSALVCAVAMWLNGAAFFRWGTMNFAFFALSIDVIFLSLVAAWLLNDFWPKAALLLALRGISSLAAVPIHYALINALVTLEIAPRESLDMVVLILAIIALTIWLAKAFAAAVRLWMSSASTTIATGALFAVLLLSAALTWASPPGSWAIFAYFVAGQLAVAGLLLKQPANPIVAGH
ncbi:MAG TPA: heparan-alpha-glucosaminide N-acetyltransferase domain-containing protein [Steroidobacteraceae bacterium]